MVTTPSGPQDGGSPAPQPKPRVNQMAVASVVTAAVGVILWPVVGGWATLIAASIALGLGVLALSRIGRTRERGRWVAITGIGLGVAFFAILMTDDGDRMGLHQPHQRAPVNRLARPGRRVGRRISCRLGAERAGVHDRD